MSPRSFDVYAPLQDFQWQGNDFELASGLRIRRLAETPDLAGLDASLAKDERERVSNASHWLTFQWTENVVPSPAEVVNLVLLSLWIVKPIRLQVAFLFEIGQEAAAKQDRRHRLIDRKVECKTKTESFR